jgi:hypothetical protein
MQAPALLAATLLFVIPPSVAAAQAPVYDSATIGCAQFREQVRGQVHTAVGSLRRSETIGRDGVLSVRGIPDSGGVRIEAWYDSLSVFRQGPEGRIAPDAEGILGGRYRGTLASDGSYLGEAAPFVPAALRDIFEFGRVMLHFFPPLPPRALRPGGEWRDDPDLTIWRLTDSATAQGPVARYGWTRRATWEEGVAAGDSTVRLHRSEAETGALQWRDGPKGWSSSVRASVELPAAGGRMEVVQEATVTRVPASCP